MVDTASGMLRAQASHNSLSQHIAAVTVVVNGPPLGGMFRILVSFWTLVRSWVKTLVSRPGLTLGMKASEAREDVYCRAKRSHSRRKRLGAWVLLTYWPCNQVCCHIARCI